MFMNVYELNYDERLQLKEMLCYGADILPEMTEEQSLICNKAMCADEIPDELILDLFDGICFTSEDFLCNVENEEE